MNVFRLRNELIRQYREYAESFMNIREPRILAKVREELDAGALWPEPLIQLNPAFEPGSSIDELVEEGVLHAECARAFRVLKEEGSFGKPLRLRRHQEEAIRAAKTGANYVLTTGTGSGKSLAYIIPIVDHVLRRGSGRGIQAIVVYPMNALANSQLGELEKFLRVGYEDANSPVTFARYTGQESDEERQAIIADPPDILLTNYVMLELILTRPDEKKLVASAKGLQFLVFDELHTYRGRQGSDVALLIRRTRNLLEAEHLQTVGTSATLAGPGTFAEQQIEVAAVASRLFGDEVLPQNVIGETLRRATVPPDVSDDAYLDSLRDCITSGEPSPSSFAGFIADPLSRWIEATFGVLEEAGTGRLLRATPCSVHGDGGAAQAMAGLTNLPPAECAEAIERGLLAGYTCEPNPETGFPAFAFRLHQFISRGETIHASLEGEDDRYLTLHPQQFVPGAREKVLLPLVFCRECGQEYYAIRRVEAPDGVSYQPRDLGDRLKDDLSQPGFLYLSTDFPWPEELTQAIADERVPEDWLEAAAGGGLRVRRHQRAFLPEAVPLGTNGRHSPDGLRLSYVPAPFRLCLRCGVEYVGRQRSDFGKLTTLGSEGRSTATTILSLAVLRSARDEDLPARARKLLSFTDNRQDASLQAGHFNDFVGIGLLRAGLHTALAGAGVDGIRDDDLTQAVFAALALPFADYATDPTVRFQAREETDRALRDVLGHRLYRDLRRGWRITSPNLEQCGLLQLRYSSLVEVCHAEDLWQIGPPALVAAPPDTRFAVCRALLDYLRRELAIKVKYLDPGYLEKIEQRSRQRLADPWAIDEDEEGKLENATIALPRPSRADDRGRFVFVSPRGGFGQYLRRPSVLSHWSQKITLEETAALILQLFEALRRGGLLEQVREPESPDDVGGYQINAAAMTWKAGDGTVGLHDPVRVPRRPEGGKQTNDFFVRFYRELALGLRGLEAREHTAQVDPEERQRREARFREADLPVLFCSPTMELGVDIAELNLVNLRNVPPTPANYAQRSGRAGRSGQPALVFTYCSTGSPHDQYFFRRPERMVRGQVTPPRLDLGNEDLVQAHVQAIWLTETGQSLGRTLKELLDLATDEPTLELLPSVHESLADQGARQRARQRAADVLATLDADLAATDWYDATWLSHVLDVLPGSFEAACERWRTLYRSALAQAKLQNKIIQDPTRPTAEKNKAKQLRREAESQLALLSEPENVVQSDFYSYRYFASEGFLPGYNFPRLPLSAFIPGRQRRVAKRKQDEFLSRPRFLAISEFGPRAVIYHEGSQYQINKVILPFDDKELLTRQAKQCGSCGYLHPIETEPGPDVCEWCGERLGAKLSYLFRLRNVSTRRRHRINSDEEERLRLGYEIRSGLRFAAKGGKPSSRTASVADGEGSVARLAYGHAATLWRINMGWSRRTQEEQHGFVLDLERGYWGNNKQLAEEDAEDPMSARVARVIPYVEDRRNCLLYEPAAGLARDALPSLQAGLKNAIQIAFQLEDNELAAEVLPDRDHGSVILLYEASEGGAGALRRLLDDPDALPGVAREALRLCHFDPATGEDLRLAPGRQEACEAACYDCLMSYTNQRDHAMLDRLRIRDHLLALADATVTPDAVDGQPPGDHFERLERLCDSDLERSFLDLLAARGHRLPTHAQQLVADCSTRPDFLYADQQIAIYIDGPMHEHADKQRLDATQRACLERLGYLVLRFDYKEKADWATRLDHLPSVFGRATDA